MCSDIDNRFAPCERITSKVVAEDKYILHVSGTNETDATIALGLSDSTCEVYNFSNNQVAKITTFSEHTDKLIGCRFSNENYSLLYTGSNDGSVKLWDIRCPEKSAISFLDTTNEYDDKKKVISCFDISPNDRLLTAGTDLFLTDAFLLFWDIRNNKLLGGYWESHTDDITQVQFHPYDNNKLVSGSTDGLINIYDLTQTSEDDALIDTLNTESSVGQLMWFMDNNCDKISCLTHTEDLQLWNVEQAEPYKHFRRKDIAKHIMQTEEDTYIVATTTIKNSIFVLAGSNESGKECLKGLKVNSGNMHPLVILTQNQQIVRSSWLNENTGVFLTGGENGILDIWNIKSCIVNNE